MLRLRNHHANRTLLELRRAARQITQRLGVYDQITLAREVLNPRPGWVLRNERDDRHLTALLAAILRPESSAIDVGANVGDVLGNIVRLAPFGTHTAFEPVPGLAHRLALRYPAVDVRAVAASDRVGVATFHWVEEMPAMSSMRLRADNTLESTVIEVRLERIDDVVTAAPRFLKIDVEGAEEAVLRGAQDTLHRYRPLVAFEHGLSAAGVFGTTPDVIHSLLSDAELRVFDMDGGGPLSRDQFVDVVCVAEHFNFFAC